MRRKLLIWAVVAGALGVLGLAVGAWIEPDQAAFSYLTAWAFAVSIALGALVFLMVGHAAGARWVRVFRPFTNAIVASLPALAVLFIPIAVALPRLYPWVHPSADQPAEDLAKLAHKAGYLDPTFFVVRTVVTFAVWIAVGELVMRWRDQPRAKWLSAAGLPAVALTAMFAAFDWLMSLTPLWESTVYGLLYWSGGFVAALSLIAVVANLARRDDTIAAEIHPSHTGALGRMMFAFLVFWAYMEFAQGLITWIANKPDEVPWYVVRGAGSWGNVFAFLLVAHFAIPFFALLSRPLKRRPFLLAIAGAWIVVMHYVDMWWMTAPALHREVTVSWLDVAAIAGVLGLAVAFVIARTRTLVAPQDPALAAAVTYEGT